MPYVRRTWQNSPSTATPLTATALNNIETGIEEALAAVAEVPASVASDMANPESDLNSATVDLILANAVPPDNAPYDYFIDDDTAAARPDWTGPVRWLTTVEVKPTNIRSTPPTGIGPDTWAFVTADPLPDVTVLADDFNRANGAIGSTSTGAVAYTGTGTGATWSVVSNQAALTAGTSGAGYAILETGYARTLFETTVATQDASFYGGVAFRYVDSSNQFTIARVSSGDFTARLVKRVANTATTIKTLTGYQVTSGTKITIDDRVLGELKVYFNDVKVYDQLIDTAVSATDLSSATKVGLYAGLVTATSIRWDDLIVKRPA